MPAVQVTNGWRTVLRDIQIGARTTALTIDYVAVGTGTTAPTAADTRLAAEIFRKPITQRAAGAAVGEALFTLSLAPQDIPGTTIQEVGWFSGGTAAANSGTLIARVLYVHLHTASENLNLQFDATY